MKKRRLRNRDRSFWFLLPSLSGVLLFFVLPFGLIIYYSLVGNPITEEFVGLDNFRALLKNPAFLQASKNTAILSLVAVPLAVLLPLGLALLLDRAMPLKSWLRTAFLSPMLVPIASVVLVWQVLFHQNGSVNALLGVNVDWFHSPLGLVMVLLLCLWRNIGYHTILFAAGLAAVPRMYLDIAELDGAGKLRQFFSIKLRFLSSTLLFVTVMSLIMVMKIFREVYLLTGSYPYETLYLLQHFMNNTFRTMDYQKLCSAAILLATVMSAVIALLLRAENRIGRDLENE